MALVPLFKNRKKYVAVVGKKGTTYRFVNHQFYSVQEEEIAELKKFAANKEAGIYIDPAEPEIDTDRSTPADRLKKKIIEEYLAEQGKLGQASESTGATPLGQSVGTTASSTIMNNGMAEIVDSAKNGTGQPVPSAVRPIGEPSALSALEKLKAQTDKS